jgi:hypothetical protein
MAAIITGTLPPSPTLASSSYLERISIDALARISDYLTVHQVGVVVDDINQFNQFIKKTTNVSLNCVNGIPCSFWTI